MSHIGQRLIAELRAGETPRYTATGAYATDRKRDGSHWFQIFARPKRMVHCTCGGAVKDRRNAIYYDNDWGGCTHIIALYTAEVIEDPKEWDAHRKKRMAQIGLGGITRVYFLARLTELGREMFYWRWTVRRLEASSS